MTSKIYSSVGETLYCETLPNGLPIYVVPKNGYTRSFACFATHYGGAMRRFELDGRMTDTPAGVAHFLEHKMFDLPDGNNALAVLAARGASPNAFTGNDMTAYYFSSSEAFEDNLRDLISFVSTPYFTAESVQKEQGIIGQEIRMTEDDPGFRVYLELMRCLFRDSPLCQSVAGTVESIAEITDKTLYDCHRAFYRPSNMALAVSGDVSPETVARIAGDILPPQGAAAPEPDYGSVAVGRPVKTEVLLPMEVSAPQFMLGASLAPAPNGEALLRQKLVCALALRYLIGRGSPFYTGLYAGGLLTNDFSFDLDYAGGAAVIMAGGESRDPAAVRSALNEQVERVASHGLDKSRFERCLRAEYGSYLMGLDSFDSLCVELVRASFGGYEELAMFDLLPRITANECAAFITDVLRPEALAMSVVTPAKGDA